MSKIRKILLGTTIASLSLTSTVWAGGFQRGTADTDILFEPGTFSTRAGLTYVDPQRGFESINGVSTNSGDYTGTYQIPSIAVGFGGDVFGCAGTYTESFAAEGDYRDTLDGALPAQVSSTFSTNNADRIPTGFGQSTSRTVRSNFNSNEFGMTCRASYTADIGRFSLLGGIFGEDFQFDGQSRGASNLNAAFAGTPLAGVLAATGSSIILPTAVDVDSSTGYDTGYRIGLAFEKPELALRVQALYRSEVEHENIDGTGTVTVTDTAYVQLANGQRASIPTVFGPASPLVLGGLAQAGFSNGQVIGVSSSLNDQTSPASFNLNAQSGIAPGTLVLASFRWTDWSTNNAAVSSVQNLSRGINSSSYAPYNWRDGYTGTIGLGKAFTDSFSGAVQLGYDRGVSTGSDTTYTDLYTLAGGVSFKGSSFGEIRLGGLVGYWTDGEQKISDGAFFNAKVGDDVVYGANASLKLTF